MTAEAPTRAGAYVRGALDHTLDDPAALDASVQAPARLDVALAVSLMQGHVEHRDGVRPAMVVHRLWGRDCVEVSVA